MLYEFCHFASTDRALESTTPSELLTPFILVFITNLTKVYASWYLGSQSILRVYINHQGPWWHLASLSLKGQHLDCALE